LRILSSYNIKEDGMKLRNKWDLQLRHGPVRLIGAIVLVSVVLASMPAETASANMTGCNGGTCLHIESYGGSGTDVSQIKVYSRYRTTQVILYVDNFRAERITLLPAQGWIWFATKPWVPNNYRDGARICATLTAMGGLPCATIHR
jgi:hypothetical protein